MAKQYGENAISKYDFQIAFDNAQTTGTHTASFNAAASDARIRDLTLVGILKDFGPDADKTIAKPEATIRPNSLVVAILNMSEECPHRQCWTTAASRVASLC